MKPALSLTYLYSILDYNPETGIFYWKVKRSGKIPSTMIAGTLDWYGHRDIIIDQRKYKAHRLAWFFINGEWPPYEIDHINGCPDDNRIVNLRLVANRWQQRANQKRRKDNQIGFKGVRKKGKKFIARCRKHGKTYSKYGFNTAGEAHAAYLRMAREFFGEFMRAD